VAQQVERHAGVPLAEVDDLGLAPQYLRLEAERERQLLDLQPAAAREASERSRYAIVALERRHGALAVPVRAASLDQPEVEARVVAKRLEALPGERLEAALGVLEARAGE
jgi:hypothetical protein